MSDYSTNPMHGLAFNINEPGPWLMYIDSMTHAEAMAAGKALGAIGITGRFLSGRYAENMQFLQRQLFESEAMRKNEQR